MRERVIPLFAAVESAEKIKEVEKVVNLMVKDFIENIIETPRMTVMNEVWAEIAPQIEGACVQFTSTTQCHTLIINFIAPAKPLAKPLARSYREIISRTLLWRKSNVQNYGYSSYEAIRFRGDGYVKRGSGCILNVSSTAAFMPGGPLLIKIKIIKKPIVPEPLPPIPPHHTI